MTTQLNTELSATLTQAQLKEQLDYDEKTGIFTRKNTNRVLGYTRQIYVNGVEYLSHSLAWLYVHGVLPPNFVRHIDSNVENNAISNLELCDKRQIVERKMKKPLKNNKFGLLGVCQFKDRFKSTLTRKGKTYHLGYFNTPLEAHNKYLEKLAEVDGKEYDPLTEEAYAKILEQTTEAS